MRARYYLAMNGGQDDRRREARVPLTLRVEYNTANQFLTDYTENVSRGGTFVLTDRCLPVGTPLEASLSFPGLIKPFTLCGTVKWVRTGPDGERGVGVQFDSLSPEVASNLDTLVQRIGEGDPALVARTMRILLVEDNPHVATLIREGLAGGYRRELGDGTAFEFTTAGNGREALDALAQEERFDLIIVDVYLPVLDGVQVIAGVRANPVLRDMPIVAVSAGGPHAREAALAAGADFFISKPMRLADIVATVRRVTDPPKEG
ncbi:MAG: TIGR02266 family protein [Pseudomonadota bacterium]